MKISIKRGLVAAAAGAVMVVGVAAPVLAEGHRDSHMSNWVDGDGSSNWNDKNLDSTNTHVTFRDCTREFTATIRRTRTGLPDPSVGSEYINCKSYADAVYAGDLSAANYHFDVTGMGIDYCVSGLGCVYNKTSVNSLTIYW